MDTISSIAGSSDMLIGYIESGRFLRLARVNPFEQFRLLQIDLFWQNRLARPEIEQLFRQHEIARLKPLLHDLQL